MLVVIVSLMDVWYCKRIVLLGFYLRLKNRSVLFTGVFTADTRGQQRAESAPYGSVLLCLVYKPKLVVVLS